MFFNFFNLGSLTKKKLLYRDCCRLAKKTAFELNQMTLLLLRLICEWLTGICFVGG